jgi:50S ribosomal protein L16 3-hydroxylase
LFLRAVVSRPRDPAASYDPGPDFWDGFVRRFWGRHPTVIRQPFARAIASPAEVFGAMVAATDRLQRDDHDFALTIDGVRAGADVVRWLPKKQDRSLERLADRIARDLPGATFAVSALAFQLELGWEIWTRVRRFLTGLYARVGVPADRAELDLFAGNYARTRRGVHLDSADVFCFVIDGRKRIRVWPPSAFPDGAYWYGFEAERKNRSRSTCLDGEPGDILYWPSRYWHVGESLGGTVSSLSLALYPRDSLATTAARLVEDAVARELRADNFVDSLPASVERLEPPPPHALRAFARASANLATAVLRRRMEHITAHAFAHIPLPPRRRRLRVSSIVAADPAFPIFYRSLGRTALVAANGRSIAVPRSKALQSLIASLNRGARVSVSQRTGTVNPDLRKVLRFLMVTGAVDTHRAG